MERMIQITDNGTNITALVAPATCHDTQIWMVTFDNNQYMLLKDHEWMQGPDSDLSPEQVKLLGDAIERLNIAHEPAKANPNQEFAF